MLLFKAAGASGWQHLMWAQIVLRVECTAQILHRGQVIWCKHFIHELDLLDANAMFARDAPATGKTLVQNLTAGLQYVLGLLVVAFIEQ